MAPVYVREQGAVVRRRGERLLVTRDKDQLFDLPLLHVDQVVLFGNVQLTTQAASMLLQAEVDVVFLSLYGKFRGRLNPYRLEVCQTAPRPTTKNEQ